MLQRLAKPSEYDVALEATEFWLNLIEEELHNQYIYDFLPRLVPFLITNMRLSEIDFLTSDVFFSDIVYLFRLIKMEVIEKTIKMKTKLLNLFLEVLIFEFYFI